MTSDEFMTAYRAGDPLAHAVATISAALEVGITDTDWLPIGPVDRYLAGETTP